MHKMSNILQINPFCGAHRIPIPCSALLLLNLQHENVIPGYYLNSLTFKIARRVEPVVVYAYIPVKITDKIARELMLLVTISQ